MKRNKELILPYNSSISMTCDGLHTKTTVEFGYFDQDTITINDEELKKDEKDIMGHIDRIRNMAGIKERAKIISESNFPVAAGLASSANRLGHCARGVVDVQGDVKRAKVQAAQ